MYNQTPQSTNTTTGVSAHQERDTLMMDHALESIKADSENQVEFSPRIPTGG